MKINNLIVGAIILALAALLLVDSIVTYVNPNNPLFTLADIKGIVAIVLLVLAASYLKASKD